MQSYSSHVGRYVTDEEYGRLLAACRALPPATGTYLETDYVTNLLLTVIDFQMQTPAVEKAIEHFRSNRKSELRSIHDLTALLERFPDTQEGNTGLAQYIWGYNLWTRAGHLRRLVEYFYSRGVWTRSALTRWAQQSDYKRDFAGRVKGLGPAVYSWLVMRQGIETVKPDVHVMRFAENTIGRTLTTDTVVAALVKAAGDLGVKAYELDWRIWEWQRSGGFR